MARGNGIIVSTDPKGRFIEGTIASPQTPKPGQIMQITPPSVIAWVGGRPTVQIFDADADGTRPKGPYLVLLEDRLQGRPVTTAYATGERALLYCPLPGDELNLLLLNIAGTGDDHASGEMLMVDDTTGKMIATASSGAGFPESEPAMLLEEITDPTADTLAWCIWTGM